MSFEKLNALDLRVGKLVQEVMELRRANAVLQEELQHAYETKNHQEERALAWEEERTQIRDRVEKVLEELDVVECQNGELHGAVAGDQSY